MSSTAGAKTSIDILRERDELAAALARIGAEVERALARPEDRFVALCRVADIVAAPLSTPPPPSGTAVRSARPKPLPRM